MANEKALMAMLQGAKAVMDKVEDKSPTKTNNGGEKSLPHEGNIEYLTEGQMANNPNATITQPKNMGVTGPKIIDGKGVYKNIENSKMPSAIKEAMLNNPIEQLSSPSHTFTLDDVSELVNEGQQQVPTQTKRTLKNPVNTEKLVGLNENQVRAIVKEELFEFLSEYFTKSLTEQVKRKTISDIKNRMKKKK